MDLMAVDIKGSFRFPFRGNWERFLVRSYYTIFSNFWCWKIKSQDAQI